MRPARRGADVDQFEPLTSTFAQIQAPERLDYFKVPAPLGLANHLIRMALNARFLAYSHIAVASESTPSGVFGSGTVS